MSDNAGCWLMRKLNVTLPALQAYSQIVKVKECDGSIILGPTWPVGGAGRKEERFSSMELCLEKRPP